MKKGFIFLTLAVFTLGACNSNNRSETHSDSSIIDSASMTDSATIGLDTNATDVTNPVPVSDSANNGLGKVPGDKH